VYQPSGPTWSATRARLGSRTAATGVALTFALCLLDCARGLQPDFTPGTLDPDAGTVAAGTYVCDQFHVLGPLAPTGSCDGSGDCGGVSEEEGCYHCALQAECGQYYEEAGSYSGGEWSLGGWGGCRYECAYPDSGTTSYAAEMECCSECDAQYPETAAGWYAWLYCTLCQYCVNDCFAIKSGYCTSPTP